MKDYESVGANYVQCHGPQGATVQAHECPWQEVLSQTVEHLFRHTNHRMF